MDSRVGANLSSICNLLARRPIGGGESGAIEGAIAMVVEVQLLGEVELRIDGDFVDIGHARQRCVLGVLAVDANKSVPAGQLVERVWPDSSAQRSRGALYNYVSRLRRACAATGELTIVRRLGSYVLEVDPMCVDLHRFRHLVGTAREAGVGVDALRRYDEALRLWRGEAFTNFDTPWIREIRDAVTQQRRAAELERTNLALDHGEHAALIPELTARAAADPFDERLAAQLMLALYRSGRPIDAMEIYQRLRDRLRDEYGGQPSPPVRRLNQQIKTADRTIAVPVPARARVTSVIAVPPRQLPTAPRLFTGRAAELQELHALLTEALSDPATVPIATLSGTAGVGKTSLAVHWAHQVTDRFPDGQLYVDLRGFDPGGVIMRPGDAIRGFLDALGVPPQRMPADSEAQVALYRSTLADRQMLVVIDNARDADQARSLLPGGLRCMAVVTSRNQLAGLVVNGAHPLTLDLLTIDDARSLLAHRLGQGRLTAEPEAIDEIVARCAGLPLALSIVAARAAMRPRFPLSALAGGLRDSRDRLNTLAAGDPAADARAVFSWSYEALDDDAARLFRLLGLHPGPTISREAAASLAGTPVRDAATLLSTLAGVHLINEPVAGRFTFHDLLRAYATEQALVVDPPDRRRAALCRVLDHYLCSAVAADRLLDPHRRPITVTARAEVVDLADARQALAWFTAEHAVILAAVERAAAAGLDSHAWQLAWSCETFLDRRGRWRDLAAVQEPALCAARRCGDRNGQALAHLGLARANAQLRRHEQAHRHLRDAQDLYRDLDDQASLARTHYASARVFGRQGLFRDALGEVEAALATFEAHGDRTIQALALNGVGWFHALLGNNEDALRHCGRALEVHTDLGDDAGQARTLDSLGYAHQHLGHRSSAVESYERAIVLWTRLGDRYCEAETLDRLGDTHHQHGDLDSARAAWHRAVARLEECDHPDAEQVRKKLIVTDCR